MITTTHLTVYTAQLMPRPDVYVVQGDTGRGITLQFVDLNIPNTATANYYVKKPVSAALIYNACTLGPAGADGTTQTVHVKFTSTALEEVGTAPMQVEIIDGDDVVTTFPLWLHILPTSIETGAIEGSNEFSALTQALQQVQGIISTGIVPKASQLATARNIGNASFDGTADISLESIGALPASGGTVTGNLAVAGSLSSYGYTVPRIQHGNISVAVEANTATTFSIAFPTAFPGVPDVVITARANSASFSYELRVKLASISATGATGVLYYGLTTTWVVHWIAMYG